MKKLVPDPPPILCIKPGLTHDAAIHNAAEHLDKAFAAATLLPDQSKPKHQAHLSDALIHLRVSKAFLNVAQAASTSSMPV